MRVYRVRTAVRFNLIPEPRSRVGENQKLRKRQRISGQLESRLGQADDAQQRNTGIT